MYKTIFKFLFLIVLLAAAIIFFMDGRAAIHRQYAGERVITLCSGEHIPVVKLGAAINGGGPCLKGSSFVIENNYKEYYASLGILVFVIVIDSISLIRIAAKGLSADRVNY